MGGESSSSSPKPSSSAAMELAITMISVMLLQADGGGLLVSLFGDQSCLDVECYLVALLSGDESNRKQHTPLHKDGSTDASLGLTFLLPLDDVVVSSRLKFKIKNAKRTLCIDKDVGEVDVPAMDLVMNSGDDDVKPKNLSYDVKSSSGENKGVLELYCKLVPLPAKEAGEPFTGYQTAMAPPASNSVAAHSPPMQMGAPPPVAYPSVGYPPANFPPATLGCLSHFAPNHVYPPPPGYLAAAYHIPTPGPAPYPQTANLLNTQWPHGYPPPAVHGHTAPRPPPGRNLLRTAIEVARLAALWKMLGSGNDDDSDGISPDAGY